MSEEKPKVEQPTFFTYDTSEFSASAVRAANEAASPSDTDDFLKVAMAEMASETPEPVPAPAPAPTPAASPNPSPSTPLADARPAQQAQPVTGAPAAAGPVNPLVAARANASGASVGSAEGLYPISDVEPAKGSREFDTSFGAKKHNKGLIAFIVLAIIAALAAAGWFGYNYLQNREAVNRLNSAIDRLRDSDEVIVPLDQAIATEIETGTSSQVLSDLMALSGTTGSMLDDTDGILSTVEEMSQFLDEDAVAASDAIGTSVTARRTLLEVGQMLLSADSTTASALEQLNAAYASTGAANERVQWALDSYNGYWEAANNGEDVSGWDLWGIAGLETEALSYIQSAQASVASAKEIMPEADLSVVDDYLAQRANHIDLLAQIDTALASGDMDSFWALGDPVAQADAAQAEASWLVPADPAELLAAAYARMTASQREAYEVARESCVEADAVINGYLGTVSGTPGQTVAADATVSEPQAEDPAGQPLDEADVQPEADASTVEDEQLEGEAAAEEVPTEGSEEQAA